MMRGGRRRRRRRRKWMPLRSRFRFTPPQERSKTAASARGCVRASTVSLKTQLCLRHLLIGIGHM